MPNNAVSESDDLSLTVTCLVRASVEECFTAWTEPEQLKAWWGPAGVTCSDAEVDLHVPGGYRIGNLLSSGRILWITGRFVSIIPPHALSYTWKIDDAASESLVNVSFEAKGGLTEVTVTHSQNASIAMRDSHQGGWHGCLKGFETHMQKQQRP